MWINKLEISRFRNIDEASLHLNNHLNVLFGANGSGKSSILEALHCLSTGHSFRTNKTLPIVKSGSQETIIFGELLKNGHLHRLGIKRSVNEQTQIRINGHNGSSQTELARVLPIIGISPESEDLLEGANKERLSYIDWLLFHVEPAFMQRWREYRRALKQRNSALRDEGNCNNIGPWNTTLSTNGEEVSEFRKRLISSLLPRIEHYFQMLLPEQMVSISYKQGWPKDIGLYQALNNSIGSDLKMGFTHYGPHRADLLLRVDGKLLSERLSRGQRKLVTVALRLAQADYYEEVVSDTPILYIDDLPAELDKQKRAAVLNLLAIKPLQTIISTTSVDDIGHYEADRSSLFHVEQGRVINVV